MYICIEHYTHNGSKDLTREEIEGFENLSLPGIDEINSASHVFFN